MLGAAYLCLVLQESHGAHGDGAEQLCPFHGVDRIPEPFVIALEGRKMDVRKESKSRVSL